MTIQLKPGEVIAHKYLIDGVLGEGGMGVVISALDVDLDRPVAIKMLLPEHQALSKVRARFHREARAAAKIQSEHVVKVYEVGTLESGEPYMVLEKLRGSDLSVVLETEGRLSTGDALTFVLQACEAVAEAHAVGIVHRDLKPENLFLARVASGTSIVKVLDFGISKSLVADTAGELSLTKTNTVLGSPLYMSPEQARGGVVDRRTDIWSLGVVLYELLTCTTPFDAASFADFSVRVLTEQPAPIRRLAPELPEGLERAIERALAKNPDDRYASIAEFAAALLPFAPRRCRISVERISAVSHAAGLVHDPLLIVPSEEPPAGVAPVIDLNLPCAPTIAVETPPVAPLAAARRSARPMQRNARALAFSAAGIALLLAIAGAARGRSDRPHAAGAEVQSRTLALDVARAAVTAREAAADGATNQRTATTASDPGEIAADSASPPPAPHHAVGRRSRRASGRGAPESLGQLKTKFGGRE